MRAAVMRNGGLVTDEVAEPEPQAGEVAGAFADLEHPERHARILVELWGP